MTAPRPTAGQLDDTVGTAVPEGGARVPALYRALAAALHEADDAILIGEPSAKSRALGAATAIVFQLIASVDFERGGELAPRLAALYGYFSTELLHIGLTDDRTQVLAVLDMLGVLMDRWTAASAMASEAVTEPALKSARLCADKPGMETTC